MMNEKKRQHKWNIMNLIWDGGVCDIKGIIIIKKSDKWIVLFIIT